MIDIRTTISAKQDTWWNGWREQYTRNTADQTCWKAEYASE